VTDCAARGASRRRCAQDVTAYAENRRERQLSSGVDRPAKHRPLGMGMTATTPEQPFEKTFRLVCRLDDADIDYVRDTAEWIRRCVARVLAVNPTATAAGVTAIVVDMSTRGRWRLMRPETVGEQLALPPEQA
jgi:hypothetical protein